MGIIAEFYENDVLNAEYMYTRSSEHKFSLAKYNLGHLYEENKNEQKAFEYYIKASEDEDELLVYRNANIEDDEIEISKNFIMCLTNLIIVENYLSHDQFKQNINIEKNILSNL